MASIFEQLRRTLRFHYYRRKNDWAFPPTITHYSGEKMASGTYEPEVAKVISDLLQAGDTFLDVGANMGYFSRHGAEIVGDEGVVFAFEVDFENYCALGQNVHGYPNIHALNYAVSDKNKLISFNRSSSSACHSIVNTDNRLSGAKRHIPSVTLDDFWYRYLDKRPVQLMKIDVEGAEPLVLNGMKEMLDDGAINHIIMEFCPRIIKNAGFDISKLCCTLLDYFNIQVIDSDFQGLLPGGAVQCDTDFQTLTDHLLKLGDTDNSNLLCTKKR